MSLTSCKPGRLESERVRAGGRSSRWLSNGVANACMDAVSDGRMNSAGNWLELVDAYLKTCTSRLGDLLLRVGLGVGGATLASLGAWVRHME